MEQRHLLVLFGVMLTAVHAMGLMEETIDCPCDAPGAFIQISQDPTIEAGQENLNATGGLQDDGSLDLVRDQPVDPERDSICVCKRVRKPSAPVRCTKSGLLHENCGERDAMRSKGYEVAPEHQLYELYPDEVPTYKHVPAPSAGKVFHDALVEQTAVKNEAVEQRDVEGKVAHIQSRHRKKNLAKLPIPAAAGSNETPKSSSARQPEVGKEVQIHEEMGHLDTELSKLEKK